MAASEREMEKIRERARVFSACAAAASRDAIAKTFAAGLPITVLEGRDIVRIFPDGRKELVQRLPDDD